MSRGARSALLLAFFLASCRSATLPAGKPFSPVSAASADQAWQELLIRKQQFTGARAFVQIRTTTSEGTRSARAAFEFHSSGDFRVSVLSPIGTTVLTVIAEGDRMTIGSESSRPMTELARILGLPAGAWSASDISMLLLGLPSQREPDGRFRYDVSPAGLRHVVADDIGVRYEPPAFPARKVIFESGTNRFEIEYLELMQL
jgi:hypothetical protein